MKIIPKFLIVIFVAAIFSGCMKSDFAGQKGQEVYFDDENTDLDLNDKNEVVIDDRQLISQKLNKKSAPKPEYKTGTDGSEITVTGDGHGNKTESRCFKNNPRLKCVVAETSFDGKTEITVYGKNGVIKNISPEKITDLLNMEADEIANAAELFETSQEADITKLLPSKNRPSEQEPLSDPEFPAQIPRPEDKEQISEEYDPAAVEKAELRTVGKNLPNRED